VPVSQVSTTVPVCGSSNTLSAAPSSAGTSGGKCSSGRPNFPKPSPSTSEIPDARYAVSSVAGASSVAPIAKRSARPTTIAAATPSQKRRLADHRRARAAGVAGGGAGSPAVVSRNGA
jgi:hypothetical protein